MFNHNRRHVYGVAERLNSVIAYDRLLARKIREHFHDDTQFDDYENYDELIKILEDF